MTLPDILNEAKADAEVARVLANNRPTKGSNMQLIKDEDGKTLRVLNTIEVTREDIVNRIGNAQHQLKQLENALAEYDRLNPPSQIPATELAQPERPAATATEIQNAHQTPVAPPAPVAPADPIQ